MGDSLYEMFLRTAAGGSPLGSSAQEGASDHFSTAPWAPGYEPGESFASILHSPADMSSVEKFTNTGFAEIDGNAWFDEVASAAWDVLPFTNGFEAHDLVFLIPMAVLVAFFMLVPPPQEAETEKNLHRSPDPAPTSTVYGPGHSTSEHRLHYRTGWKDATRSPLTGEFNEPTTGVEEYSDSEWKAYCLGYEERMSKDYTDQDVRESRVKQLKRAFQEKSYAVEARNELRNGPNLLNEGI